MTSNEAIPIHDAATRWKGKRLMSDGSYNEDGKGNGLGVGQPGDPMNTLTSADRHAVAYVKAARARSAEDAESWREDTIAPTLNVFDNGGDTRATVLTTYPLDLRNALRDPDKLDEQNRQGVGVGNAGDPAHTVTTAAVHGVAITDDKVGALCATDGDKWGSNQWVSQNKAIVPSVDKEVDQMSVVRRLTPMECERLQGFPDGWTSERFDYKKNQVIDQPDSARYKQMGNAVAVPVVSWIVANLVEWENGQ